MKSLLSWVVAALVAVVLVGVTDGGGAEAAVDPYWTTCAELAGGGHHQTAVALTARTGLPALTAPQMAAALDKACASRSPHYRPGIDAVRTVLEAPGPS